MLRGWRDRGSCFELRAGSNLDGTSTCLYEAEVLLLAPGTWAHTCLGLFGLEVEGLQVRREGGGAAAASLAWPCWALCWCVRPATLHTELPAHGVVRAGTPTGRHRLPAETTPTT